METETRFTFATGRAALLATACMLAPALAGDEKPRPLTAISDEQLDANQGLEEARELLRKGDEFYRQGEYEKAVQAFSGSRELIPDHPSLTKVRKEVTERHVVASIEHARELARQGHLEQAKAAVAAVLAPDVAPKHKEATKVLEQLQDPIRTNPALTPEYVKDVDEVRRLLYTAEGAYHLGNFDQAEQLYQQVLLIDATNTAARRGMETVAAAKSEYRRAAHSHTRAEMLGQVEQGWELKPVPLDGHIPGPGIPGDHSMDLIPVANKLERIIIPRVDLEQATLEEAIDFLRLRAAEYDQVETDPEKKGVNFNIDLGPGDSPVAREIRNTRFNLQLRNVPLSQVLAYVGNQTRTQYTTDPFSVIFRPLGAVSDVLLTRTYRVPPDFITSLSSSSASAGAAADPFAEPSAGGSLLARRRGVQEVLLEMGVTFPEGAVAAFNPSSSILRVVNTHSNLNLIEQIIEAVTQTEPVLVSMQVTMIQVEETRLHELGFDWLLGTSGSGADWVINGGSQGNGAAIDDLTGGNPVTSGNRSGSGAITGNAIDSLINNSMMGDADLNAEARAPGIFGVKGVIDSTTVQAMLRGMEQQKGVDVMAKPSIVTRSNQASSIELMREFTYPTEYEPPELPNNVGGGNFIDGIDVGGGGSPSMFPVTPAHPTAFEMKRVGVVMDVLPTVDQNKQRISVSLSPSFSEFDGFINYGSPIYGVATGGSDRAMITSNEILMPVFSTKQFTTSLDIADGATIVIGGLQQQSVQNVEDKLPILGNVPVVGRLFQSEAKQSISTAIIFLVHIELLDPTGRPYRDRQ